jgi:hypothetical protein
MDNGQTDADADQGAGLDVRDASPEDVRVDGPPEADGLFRGVAQMPADSPQERQFDRFGLYIGRSALPGDRDKLRQTAELLLAPDDVLAMVDELPPDVTFRDVAEIWAVLAPRFEPTGQAEPAQHRA